MPFPYVVITATIDENGDQKAIVSIPTCNPVTLHCAKPGKTAAILEAIHALTMVPDGLMAFDIILLVDDDTFVGDPMKIIQRFADPNLGVLCGNREFTSTRTMASATRHVWGAFARPVMKAFDIPCGAVMAFRRQLLPDLIEVWKRSVFDDTAAAEIAWQNGYTFRYTGDELERCPDDSNISWPLFWEFVVRQYADVKAIGPWERLICAWGIGLAATVAAYYFLGWFAPLIYLGAFLMPIKRNWRVLLALPLAQLSFLIGVPVAGLSRRIKWKHRTVDMVTQQFI